MHTIDDIALIFVTLFAGGFWIAYSAIKSDAQVKLAKLKGGKPESESVQREVQALRTEVAELKQQLNELRDTSTTYDLSIDATLHRLEQRIEQEVRTQRIGG